MKEQFVRNNAQGSSGRTTVWNLRREIMSYARRRKLQEKIRGKYDATKWKKNINILKEDKAG